MKILTAIITICFCICSTAQDVDTPAVLLVSSSIQQADVLAGAAGDDVLVIQYEPKSTNLNGLLHAIEEKLAGRKAASIGFAAHDYGEAKFYLTGQETISFGSTLSNIEQQRFWKALGKLIVKDGRIDLFACNLARGDQGKMLISALEELSGTNVAASQNETGNSSKGGDWVMETANLDISKYYFKKAKLKTFSGLLWAQRNKIEPGDPGGDTWFGENVCISGDLAIVGAAMDDDNGNQAGSAYIYSRNHEGADNWGQVKKLMASDGAPNDRFGYSVAIYGDYAIVGAVYDDDNGDSSGAVFLFSRNHGGVDNWGEVKKLSALDNAGGHRLGNAVAISGEHALVGAYSNRSVYVFSRNQGGANNWGQIQKLSGDNSFFGVDVSLSGNTAIVGQQYFNAGAAFIFEKDQGGTDSWGQVKKITISGGGAVNFGLHVAISGATAIVGAHLDNEVASYSGAAYIFSRNMGGANNWGQMKKLTASDGQADDYFGYSVSISGDTAIVGVEYDDDNGNRSGSAYVFSRNLSGADNWGMLQKKTALDAAASDHFGSDVSISGDYAIVGADWESRRGSAYIFQPEFTVTVNSAPNGNTNRDGDNVVFPGQSIVITATPSPGYVFSNWSGDASGSANPLTINNVQADYSITPLFSRTYGTLNVSIAAAGTSASYAISGPLDFNGGNSLTGQTGNYSQVVPSGAYTVTYSEDVRYNFSGSASTFTVSGHSVSGSLGASATETISGTYVRATGTLTVNLSTDGTGASYSISGPSDFNGGNSLTGQTGNYSQVIPTGDYSLAFSEHISHNFSAPASSFTVSGYSVSGSLGASATETISATYVRATGTLTVNLSPDGTGASYSISGPSDFNGGNPLTAQTGNYSQVVPTGDYSLAFSEHISHNFSVIASSFTISGYSTTGGLANAATETINSSYNIKQYSVNVGAAALGHTDNDGANVVDYGSSFTITPIPDYGASFNGWSGDFATSDNPLTISNITQDYSLTPVFSNRKGSLRVHLNGTEDGRWRLVGKSRWLRSGEVQTDLHFGGITVECLPVAGYRKPFNKVVAIRDEGTREITLDYIIFTDAPIMHYFTATPDEVSKGDEVTLAWEAEGSHKVIITPGVGEINNDIGTVKVQVNKDSVFTLAAKNADRTSFASTTVTVAPILEILGFTSDKNLINKEDSVTLTWLTRGAAKTALLNKSSKEKIELETQGSLVLTPEKTSLYQLIATDASGKSVNKTIKVKVTEDVVVNYFRSSTGSVFPGQPATLSWEVHGADAVDIAPAIGQVKASGEMTVNPDKTTTYLLTTTGNGTEKTATVAIAVVEKAPDLKLSLVGVTSKGKVVSKSASGELTTISLTLENLGSETARDVKVALETEKGSCSSQVINKVAPGEKVKVEFLWCAHAKGKHSLKIIADPENVIGELDEDNNLVRKTLRATGVIGVDLLMDNMNVVLAEDGKTARVCFTVLNVGSKASESFQYQLFLTKGAKQNINKALALVADDHLDSLAPGESVTVTRVVKLKKITKRLYLQAKVDIHNAIAEANEENNHIVRKVK